MELKSETVSVTDNVLDLAKAFNLAWSWETNSKVIRHSGVGGDRDTYTKFLVEAGKSVLTGGRKDLYFLAVKYLDTVRGLITLRGDEQTKIFHIVTDEEGWKQGKATEATRIVFEWLFALGIKKILIEYPASNKVAKNFFSRFGFTTKAVVQGLDYDTFDKIMHREEPEIEQVEPVIEVIDGSGSGTE